MCGIIGYVGKSLVVNILIEGLRRLEYRGYDSAGIGLFDRKVGKIVRLRASGKLVNLERLVRKEDFDATIGIGHTRWATHGVPNEINAHPHKSGPFVVVHNGIIENFWELKQELQKQGLDFESETDTEVIVKLIDFFYSQGMGEFDAFLKMLEKIKGTYAIVLMCEHKPDRLYVARNESPVVIGIGEDGNYVASDIPALLPFTQRIIYLEDGDVAEIKAKEIKLFNQHGESVERAVEIIDLNPISAEKGHYKHFMQKEIFEQPRAISDTFKPYIRANTFEVVFPQSSNIEEFFEKAERIFLIACGTSYHAAMVGKYMFETMLPIPCEADIASEFRYRKLKIDKKTLVIAISQSGETADTKGALALCRDKGAMTCSIVNVLGSSIARMSNAVIYTHAGPEIGVASTKAFTAQLVSLALLIAKACRVKGEIDSSRLIIQSLLEIPGKVEKILKRSNEIIPWAKELAKAKSALYLGRNILFPIALEGALKLKEISYIHAEGYAGGEMKHGPIALIDETMPVVCLVQRGFFYAKMKGNIEEVKARNGRIYVVADENLKDEFFDPSLPVFWVPSCYELLSPILFVLPLQLLAYYTAVEKGTDVDQPRNLAKSVTVE